MTKLALIEIDKKHDCPVGQYERDCDGYKGECLHCGINVQRDNDLIAAKAHEEEALKQQAKQIFGSVEIVEFKTVGWPDYATESERWCTFWEKFRELKAKWIK